MAAAALHSRCAEAQTVAIKVAGVAWGWKASRNEIVFKTNYCPRPQAPMDDAVAFSLPFATGLSRFDIILNTNSFFSVNCKFGEPPK